MANLYLSHWNAAEKVYVPIDICKKLKPYHLSIVRSLYRCWKNNLKGAILNYDEGIDIPLAIQALWQALINADKVKLPFLIIVSDKNVILWHFYLSQLGEVTILNSQNVEMVSKNKHFSIILVPQSNIKLLKACEENDYSFIVVEDIDNIATSRSFKKLSGRFNIALTRRNFLVNRDCKILWHILNWINPDKFGKLNEFPR
ncbi:hypothetical protein AMK59_7510 [Oryctes borbonicus]|uniref:Uncharacterized protein n=1 Tax=Oryctes borbonicus TaxID=1629725 RepID=A0A0T6AVV2_9SCAR|nr:hypothetical protein AMK59_7510 [Oryctes borbonicus]